MIIQEGYVAVQNLKTKVWAVVKSVDINDDVWLGFYKNISKAVVVNYVDYKNNDKPDERKGKLR